MKPTVNHGAAMLSAILILCLISLPAASQCSRGSVAGYWAYTYSGSILTASGALPAAAVGHFRQDEAGNVSGGQVRSVAGDSANEDISGQVTVHKDCTATATINVTVSGVLQRTAVLSLVYDDNANHARMIFQSLTLPDGTNVPVVLTVDGSRVVSANDRTHRTNGTN